MKKIIDGKRYDTETSTEIDRYSNGHHAGDLHRYSETLYRTKSGAWFLHRRGGPLSEMGESIGNERHGSEDIQPLTTDEAFTWLAKNDPAKAEEHFADRIQDA